MRLQDVQAESEILQMAQLLSAEHRHDADIVAALRADGLFRAGNAADATRWLNVFRRIALSRSRNAGQRGDVCSADIARISNSQAQACTTATTRRSVRVSARAR
jgi:hypothetical protein